MRSQYAITLLCFVGTGFSQVTITVPKGLRIVTSNCRRTDLPDIRGILLMDFAQNPGLTAQHYFDLSKKRHIARAVSYGRSPGDQNDLPGFFREICKSRKFSGRFYPPLTAVLFFESADSVLRGLESGDYLLRCSASADSFSLLRGFGSGDYLLRCFEPADSFSLLRCSSSVD